MWHYKFPETEHGTGFPSGEATLRFCPGDNHGSIPPCNVVLSPFQLRTHSLRLWFTLTGSLRGGGLTLWSSNAASSGSNTHSDFRSSDISGSFGPDQIAGRRELDEVPATTGSPPPETDEVLPVEDDGSWYMGKAGQTSTDLCATLQRPSTMKTPYRYI